MWEKADCWSKVFNLHVQKTGLQELSSFVSFSLNFSWQIVDFISLISHDAQMSLLIIEILSGSEDEIIWRQIGIKRVFFIHNS